MDFIKGDETVQIDPSGISISSLTNKIILNTDGKVGIGTNKPQHALQVNGTQSIFSNTPEILLFKEDGPGRLGPILDWGNTTYTDWKIKSDTTGLNILSGAEGVTTESITINSLGNVGIGTSDPIAVLNINNTVPLNNNNIRIAGSATVWPTESLWLGKSRDVPNPINNVDIKNYWGMSLGVTYAGHGYIQPLNTLTGNTYYNLLLNPHGGMVGIGISDPIFDFQVHNDGNHTDFFVTNGASTSGSQTSKAIGVGLICKNYDHSNASGILEFRESAATAGGDINYGFHVAYNGATDDYIQNYYSNTFVISRFNNNTTPEICIGIPRSNGFVGFGIQNPTTRIEVATQSTNVEINSDMYPDGTFISGGDPALTQLVRLNNNRTTLVDSDHHYFEVADYDEDDYDTGNAGGTDVAAARLRSCAHFGSSITIEGGVYLESDRRIKHDIQLIDLSSCLMAINNIPLYKYKYNNFVTRDKKDSYGFMAQDVQKVLPAVVNQKDDYLPCVMEYVNGITWEQINYLNPDTNKEELWWKLHIPVLMYDASNNPINFEVGTQFKFYLTDDYKKIDGSKPTMSTLMDGNNFLVNQKKQYCLVVGYKTPDFLTLEKERLFTIYHGAIQELSHRNDRLEAENTAKSTEIAELKNEISLIKQHLGI